MACYDVVIDSKQTLTHSTIYNLKMACHEIVNNFEWTFDQVSDL